LFDVVNDRNGGFAVGTTGAENFDVHGVFLEVEMDLLVKTAYPSKRRSLIPKKPTLWQLLGVGGMSALNYTGATTVFHFDWSTMQSTITARGQTVVPAAIRSQFHLGPTDRLEWIFDSGSGRVVPVRANPIEALKGHGKGGATASLLAERKLAKAVSLHRAVSKLVKIPIEVGSDVVHILRRERRGVVIAPLGYIFAQGVERFDFAGWRGIELGAVAIQTNLMRLHAAHRIAFGLLRAGSQ